MKSQDRTIFTKQELLEHLIWINNVRLLLGSFFFVNFSILLLFKIYVDPGYEIGIFLGLFLFTYAILTRYYLLIQKSMHLGEMIFLSCFLSLLDLIFVTGFIYFTGVAESPHFILYFLCLASIPVAFPFFPQAVFIWSLVASFSYDLMLYMHLMARPFFLGFVPGSERAWPVVYRLTLINGVGVPISLLFFATVAFFMSRYLSKFRIKFNRMVLDELNTQEEIAALANISWILTRIYDPDYMLERMLRETLKILKISAGAIFIADPKNEYYCKKISIGVPQNIMAAFSSLKPGAKIPERNLGLKHLLDNEKIKEVIERPIAQPDRKSMGKMVFFVRADEDISKRGLFVLDSIISELSISLAYARICDKLRSKKRKEKRA